MAHETLNNRIDVMHCFGLRSELMRQPNEVEPLSVEDIRSSQRSQEHVIRRVEGPGVGLLVQGPACSSAPRLEGDPKCSFRV